MKTKTTSAKTPKLKPRRMWANYYPDRYFVLHPTKRRALRSCSSNASHVSVPVVIIPLDNVEGLVDAAVAAYRKSYNESRYSTYQDSMMAALRSIGIPVPVKKEGRK